MSLLNLLDQNDFKKTTDPNKIRYKRCPFCENEKYKFIVYKASGFFKCFRCNKTGKLSTHKITVDAFTEKVRNFTNGQPIEEKSNTQRIELPNELIPEVKPSSGVPYNYLRKRGISDDEIRRFQIGYCSDGDFSERIILPIFERGEVVYFIGRTYTAREPKYLNVGRGRATIIFKTFTGTTDFCVLTEGVFDAISVGKVFPAISILGKVLSHSQAKKIAMITKKVFVMLDKDAKKDTFIVANQLSYYIEAVPVFINKKDPGVMTPEEIKGIILCQKKS